MAPNHRWIVTTSGERPLRDIARELGETGFAVDQVLDEIGCITGEASVEVADGAKGIRGVADVSPDTPVDIGPPGSVDTW